jgi:hypothetical protein
MTPADVGSGEGRDARLEVIDFSIALRAKRRGLTAQQARAEAHELAKIWSDDQNKARQAAKEGLIRIPPPLPGASGAAGSFASAPPIKIDDPAVFETYVEEAEREIARESPFWLTWKEFVVVAGLILTGPFLIALSPGGSKPADVDQLILTSSKLAGTVSALYFGSVVIRRSHRRRQAEEIARNRLSAERARQ